MLDENFHSPKICLPSMRDMLASIMTTAIKNKMNINIIAISFLYDVKNFS